MSDAAIRRERDHWKERAQDAFARLKAINDELPPLDPELAIGVPYAQRVRDLRLRADRADEAIVELIDKNNELTSRVERVEAAVRHALDEDCPYINCPSCRALRAALSPVPGPQTGEACAMCGKNPADGLATIGDKRYCHGEARPSCYERASWAQSVERGRETLARRALPVPGREDGDGG